MGLELRGWDELGVVSTIYEEDDDEDTLSVGTVPSLDHTPCATPPQFSGVANQRWCLETRQEPDVLIHVQDSCFQLHKEALTSRSPYLKRKLSEMSEITLSPPLNITAQTFSLVTDFCYGAYVAITPFNLASLRTASELLEMTEEGDSLGQKTEGYFLRVVAVNGECARIVLDSCLSLLPEVEATSSLASRCIEALCSMSGGDFSWLEGVVAKVRVGDLRLILESLSRRLTERHDLLYRIIDLYFKDKAGKITEDEKIQMCNYIDCGSLSPRLLMHAVQNPKMPLRFIVQAMFVEQLTTRHSIISAVDHHRRPVVNNPKAHHLKEADPITLGAILERDAALRQVSHLKTAMNATYSRIHMLEKELSGMKKLLSESEKNGGRRIDSGRSASFRLSSEAALKDSSSKVSRGQKGSASSLSLREFKKKRGVNEEDEISFGDDDNDDGFYDHKNGVAEKNLGRRLMSGLRSVFRLQKKKQESAKETTKPENHRQKFSEKNRNVDDVVIVKKDQPFHRRSRSQS